MIIIVVLLMRKILHFGEKWEARGSWSWKPRSVSSAACM